MLLLGIDLSTTGAKALLVDAGGEVVASATTPLTLSAPQPLWSEQSPDDWWAAVARSVRTVLAQGGRRGDSVGAVGLTGQMHGLVLLDDAGRVPRPAILWNDQRTAAECDEIRHRIGRERLIQLSGNDALTGFTAPKILWVRRHEPEIYARIQRILLPKDFIRLRLTGEIATDRAGAAGTLLFDLAARDWSSEILSALEIPTDWLPQTHEGPEITGRVSAAAAAECGLAVGTPVVAGAGDQAAGAVGMGAVRPGVTTVTVGTSGVVFTATDRPQVEPEGRLHAFCHAAPGRWHLMGVMLSAAGSLQWYRDTLAPGIPFDRLVAEAETVPAGSEGLFFLPYLSGERTPHPDPLARGGWIGLTGRHGRGHLTRALLEGVAFGLRDVLTLLREGGRVQIPEVRITGGGTKSPLWRQILAGVLDVDLLSVSTSEGAAYGAALLAATGAGLYPTVDAAVDATVRVTGRQEPVAADVPRYAAAHHHYRALYPTLAPHFHAVARPETHRS